MRRPLRISSAVALALAVGAAVATAQTEPSPEAPAPAPVEAPTDAAPATITEGPDTPPAPERAGPEPQPEAVPAQTPEPATPPDTDAGSLVTPQPEPAPGEPSTPPGGIQAAFTCLAPTDVAGIDAVLARAGSPLAGHGIDFVDRSREVGLDPRFLVAVAAHETVLMTYGPSRLISNPFGLGPGWSFEGPAEAIDTATDVLADGYLSQGLTTVPAIGAKWAPVGAANDPTDLNSAWPAGVGSFYAALGGDPAAQVLLTVQGARPGCAPGSPAQPAQTPAPTPGTPADSTTPGPVVVNAWDGTEPTTLGPGPTGGHDPLRGAPATVSGFVFPVAARLADAIAYRDPRAVSGGAGCAVGGPCAIRIEAGAGAPVIASRTGTIARASIAEQEAGIGFWIQPRTGIRVGYGALAAYADGIRAGQRVTSGTLLGASGEAVTFALEHGGQRINPYPLLSVTRPPASPPSVP